MPLLMLLHSRKAKFAFDGLREYAETLERLLATEEARVLTHETLADLLARSRDPALESEEPSDELVRLRDSFPTILRGSLLPYIHGSFERSARSMANSALPESTIPKDKNTNEIAKRINTAWPGTIDTPAVTQLADYMHLRHMCAHTAGEVGSALLDPKRVATAADRTPGASFKPYADKEADPASLTKAIRWAGRVEFDTTFLPQAIAFHMAQIEAIARAVVTPLNPSASTV